MRKYLSFVTLILILIFVSCSDRIPESSSQNIILNSESIENTTSISPIEFNYNSVMIFIGTQNEQYSDKIKLNDNQTNNLEKILQKDKWQIANNLPILDFVAAAILYDENDNVAHVNDYEGKALIITKYAKSPNEGVYYFAPIEIIQDIQEYFLNINK